MDWSLHRCGRTGHITYAPDEAPLREQMHAATASGDLWQCLRCGNYVRQGPDGRGPAAAAPIVRRGKEIRGDLILKLFAIERGLRVLLFGAVAVGIWKFASSRLSITAAIKKELPIVRSLFSQLGFTLSHSVLDRLHSLLHISASNLHLIALGIAGLAVVSGIEAFALWQAHRWGEYFAMIVTSLGLPLEVYELSKAITAIKAVLFVLNLLLVIYLVYSRRLFGVRGGKTAYEQRLRAESVIDAAARAAAAKAAATGTAPIAGGQAAGSVAPRPSARSADNEPSPVSPWPPAAPPAEQSPWPLSDPRAQPSRWPSADQPTEAAPASTGSPWPAAERPSPANPWPTGDQLAGPGGTRPPSGRTDVQPTAPAVPPAGPRPAAATIRYTRPAAADPEPPVRGEHDSAGNS